MLTYKYQEGGEELYIDCFQPQKLTSSYVDINDLRYCLSLFFCDELDDCDHYISRIYLPEYRLNPSNTLFGQIDVCTMQRALDELPEDYSDIIRIFFIADPDTSAKVQHYYVNSSTILTFSAWAEQMYSEALLDLAERVRQLL